MAIRHILEKLIGSTGSSGFGFPFSLKHMNFYLACIEAKNMSKFLFVERYINYTHEQ
jgi:hypothetical protein